MKVTIDIQDNDADSVSSFATATGWDEKRGISQNDWLLKKTTDWIESQVRNGKIQSATSTERKALVDATLQAIGTVGSGGGVITKP